MDGGFNEDGAWCFGDGHECSAALDVRCPTCAVMVVQFVPAPPDETDW